MDNQTPKRNLQDEINKQIEGYVPYKKPEQVEQTQPVNVEQEVPQIQEPSVQSPADSYVISPIRTYKQDVSDSIQGGQMNASKILIAEQKKRQKEKIEINKNSLESNTNKFKLFVSVFLIALAVVAIIYGSYKFLTPKPLPVQDVFANLKTQMFVLDEAKNIDISDKKIEETRAGISEFTTSEFKESTINSLILYKNVKTGETQTKQIISLSDFISIFGFQFTENLSRSLSNEYIFGVYRLNSINRSFLFIKLSDFGIAYESMFKYEGNLVKDMRSIFRGFGEFDE